MVAIFTVGPMVTTTGAGLFNVTSDGLMQGTAYDAPNRRNDLAGGVLASSEVLPMWGGVGISEAVPGLASGPQTALGGLITRATTLTAAAPGQLTGFSVSDQAYHMMQTPQSPVPQATSGMGVHFYRLGSGARIAVQIDPDLVSLQGGLISPNVSWDFNNSVLQPYVASGATEAVTSFTWSATNGGQVAVVMAAATPWAVGDIINTSGATNTGNGSLTVLNGPHVISTFTDSTHFTFLLPGTSANWGTLGGTIVINVGIGALPVKVLEIQIGNSMVVNYDPVTGFTTWNRSGSAAIILI